MALDPAALADKMDRLATLTWDYVYDAPQYGIAFNEEAITSQNLYVLARGYPDLHIRAFSHSEERVNGADWEWWIGSDRDGWIGMRIQAKKLTGNRYRQISYRATSATESQCRTLIRTTDQDAESQALLPFYCFYNGWDRGDGWPAGVPWTVGCSQPAECLTVKDVRVFGCALAPARRVLRAVQGLGVGAGLPRDDYGRFLPEQWPWSWLFADLPKDRPVRLPDVLNGWLKHRLLKADETSLQRPFERLPSYAQATRYPDLVRELQVNDEDVPVSTVLVADLGPPDRAEQVGQLY